VDFVAQFRRVGKRQPLGDAVRGCDLSQAQGTARGPVGAEPPLV